jgi:2',3'-cyclic-nucleotide 2'-phosphodiesterase (5'-nucleotidase family)
VLLALALVVACATVAGGAAPVDRAEPPPPTALVGELAVEGPLRARLSAAPADLVLLYGSEHKGSMETCGCPRRPRGSLARLDAYADAVRRKDTPVLVHAGYFLEDGTDFEGRFRPDVALQDRWMVEGLSATGWDAINVAGPDLVALMAMAADGAPAVPLPMVSANVRAPGLRTHVVVERGGLRIGITGISAPPVTMAPIPDGAVLEPVAAARAVLDSLAQESDVLVLLAYQSADAARALARLVPALGVVVDAGQHRDFLSPVLTGGTAWVFSTYQTMRLGELRVRTRGHRVLGGVDRKIDLDPDMPDDPEVAALQARARAEIDAAQQALYAP